MAKITVKIGTRFQSAIADGNPFWKVTRKVATGAWEAVCVDDYDHAGTVKLFSSHEIIAALSFDRMWKEKGNEHDEYYASLKVGQTVHYCNGFKEFVECVVVHKDGKNILQPVALKGEWRKWDLPQRQPDGLIHLGYHAKMIVNKETFTPNYTTIVEFSGCAYKDISAGTVAKLPRIVLDVPPMDARQLQVAGIIGVLDSVANMIDEKRKDVYGDPATDLAEVRKKVAEFLTSSAAHMMLLDERAKV